MELGLFEKITFFPPDPLLMWMGEAVWGDPQPQPQRVDIMLTPQVTQNPKIWAVQLCKALTVCVCQWTVYQCAQTLCRCVIWMWEAVWGGCQPQPQHNDINLTPRVTQKNLKIWAK
jgi:hypothetical protein